MKMEETFDRLMQASGLPRNESRRLMSLVTGKAQTWLMAHGDDTADADVAAHFATLAGRRRNGEPLAYLLGEQEFHGHRFAVSPAVLIPRADTETLVEVACERLAPWIAKRTARCTDIGSCAHVQPGAAPITEPTSGQSPSPTPAPVLTPTPPQARSTRAPQSTPTTQPASAWPAHNSSLNQDNLPTHGDDAPPVQTGMGHAPLRLLDLGTGSGIIAITLALLHPEVEVHAVERSADALALAQENARTLGASRIRWHHGSWWDALQADEGVREKPGSCTPPDNLNKRHSETSGAKSVSITPRFDLIVSNPPYIAAADHHLQQGDLRFEPQQALASGADGLDDLRIIIAGAPTHLAPGGWLLLEHGYDQQDAVQALLKAAGFEQVFTWRDLAGQPRVSGGVFVGTPGQP
ncbi:MAG: methyltransferase domain-containing protein [Lautropia sp.]|nr:methyltransferase domain-containing protein [Lautropia sp.]